jgi:proline-rich protein PRCC
MSEAYGRNDIYRVDASGAYDAQAFVAAGTHQQHHYKSAPSLRMGAGGGTSAGPVRPYDYFPQEHGVATAYEGTLETLQESTTVAAEQQQMHMKQQQQQQNKSGASDPGGLSLLQAELERERERQVKLGRKPGKMPQIVNITQEKLKYVAPTINAAQKGTDTAFGPQYQAQLRHEAGDKGTKTARKKHQIGTLYHDMKLAELEMLEKRTTGQKSKAETAAKYGW